MTKIYNTKHNNNNNKKKKKKENQFLGAITSSSCNLTINGTIFEGRCQNDNIPNKVNDARGKKKKKKKKGNTNIVTTNTNSQELNCGIVEASSSLVNIFDTTAVGNQAVMGSIFCFEDSAVASVTSSIFENNISQDGGAIYCLGCTLTVSNSYFSNNSATSQNSQGGAIFISVFLFPFPFPHFICYFLIYFYVYKKIARFCSIIWITSNYIKFNIYSKHCSVWRSPLLVGF